MHPNLLLDVWLNEWPLQVQQLVQYYPQAPNIQFIVLFLLQQDLRAIVQPRPNDSLALDASPIEIGAP